MSEELVQLLQELNKDRPYTIDMDRFMDTMLMVMDENDPGQQFIQLFVRECDRDIRKLHELINEEGTVLREAEVRTLCHALVGRCAQMGAIELERQVRELHWNIKLGQLDRNELGNIEDEWQKLRNAFIVSATLQRA